MLGPLRIKKIDHVAVCVDDLDGALEQWRAVLGLTPRTREVVPSQRT